MCECRNKKREVFFLLKSSQIWVYLSQLHVKKLSRMSSFTYITTKRGYWKHKSNKNFIIRSFCWLLCAENKFSRSENKNKYVYFEARFSAHVTDTKKLKPFLTSGGCDKIWYIELTLYLRVIKKFKSPGWKFVANFSWFRNVIYDFFPKLSTWFSGICTFNCDKIFIFIVDEWMF